LNNQQPLEQSVCLAVEKTLYGHGMTWKNGITWNKQHRLLQQHYCNLALLPTLSLTQAVERTASAVLQDPCGM
jgi:hypothetical protein